MNFRALFGTLVMVQRVSKWHKTLFESSSVILSQFG